MKLAIELLALLLWSLKLAVTASPTTTTATKPRSHTSRPRSPPSQKPTRKPATIPKPPPTRKLDSNFFPIVPPPSTPSSRTTARTPTRPSPVRRPASSPVRRPPPPSPVKPRSPPVKPVRPPPTSPTSSLFSITTDSTTYSFNKTITVTFVNKQARRDDFIAIFPASTSTNALTEGIFWLWLCNQQGQVCSTALSKGTVKFGANGPPSAWSIHWPLPAGQYRAYLLRDASKGPFTPVARSPIFKVVMNFNEALDGAKKAIKGLINQDANFIPQFLRLIFHDCIGGCDGCIDLSNHDNSGLAGAINALTPIVQSFANSDTGISRADIWSMSAIVAADVANKGRTSKSISFTYNWVGRVNCEVANKVCRNANKQVVPCAPTSGPHRNIPGPNLNTTGFFAFFENAFGFNKEQAVAAMGAHAMGRLFRENSGIDGPDGWEINNNQLHSEYYQALLGSATASSTSSELLSKSPLWKQIFLQNKKFNRPDRHFWRLEVVGKNLTMLDADIAMVRDLNPSNMDASTGQVSCKYNPALGKSTCPLAGTIAFAQKFLNNDNWLAEFKSVLDLISTNGYTRKKCSSSVCRLVRK